MDGDGEAKGACPEVCAFCFFCLAFFGTLAGYACLISAWAMDPLGIYGGPGEWKAEYDDRAKKTWASGYCLVLDRVITEKEKRKNTKGQTKTIYRGQVLVQRQSADETDVAQRRLTAESLLTCDFDDSTCGFEYTADYEWTRLSGPTPTNTVYSGATGPNADHTSGSGYYMYVEASYENNPDVGPFTLTSPTFAECVGEVNFYYHLNGAGMGTLELEETTDGTSWSTIWTKSGDQGDSWQSATVSVTTSYVSQLRWVGTTGSDAYSDMAIDDVDIRSAPDRQFHMGSVCFPTSIVDRGFDGTTALAFQWPHQAKVRKPAGWRKGYDAGYEEKHEAKRFVNKYDIEQIVTCFWDKDDPSKAAMNNDGGKGWGKIRTGIALAIAGTALVSPGFLFFCYICVGSCCIKDRSEPHGEPRSAMNHARLMRARSFERARSFTSRTNAPAPQPAPPPPHVGPSSFSSGEEIRIRSNGGTWCEGVIQGLSNDGYYTVRYTDGSGFVEQYVAASRLRRVQLQGNSHPTCTSLDDARESDDVEGVERVAVAIDDAAAGEFDAPSCDATADEFDAPSCGC